MKLYLASFFQPENHGPGRLIAISSDLPHDIKGQAIFKPFAPNEDVLKTYRKEQLDDQVKASNKFVSSYKDQLNSFVEELKKTAGDDPQSTLPFKDGDTLASWEREGFTSYRKILAGYLQELGYEVELH